MAFERLLARLEAGEPGDWVLKGGMALEMRWRERARTTKDLDLATRHRDDDAPALRARLIGTLAEDPDGDGFGFEVDEPSAIEADQAGRPGWRVSVRSTLAGRTFAAFRLDVVARTEELTATERLRMPGSLSFAGIEPREIEIVSLPQHFAEKLHAMTRIYGGDRRSTRVRDLVDLVLVIEEGPPDPQETARAVETVFASRDTHPVPVAIGDPPAAWREKYEGLAAELDLDAETIDDALRLVRDYWSTVSAVGATAR